MITELKIESFKSFGTPPERLLLGPTSFVVGANASGKTNLIKALHFLHYAVRENVEFAVNEMGGIGEVRNRILRERKEGSRPTTIMVRIHPNEFGGIPTDSGKSLTVSEFYYSIALNLRDESGIPVIESEIVQADLKDSSGAKIDYRLKRFRDEVEILDHTGLGPKDNQKLKVPPQESTRLALGVVGFFSLPAAVLREEILGWRFYSISPERARLPFKDIPDADLGPHGENLSVILHKIEQMNGRGMLDSIVAGLRGAVPGFKDIKTFQLPVEGKWAFQVIEERIKGAMNPDSVSDGTIRLLALLVVADWTSNNSSLVSIEEPENGLHPHLSEHVVNVLRAASLDRQIIATTHNPSFLDYLEPEEVVLCDKKDGFTKLRRASDVEQIEHFRKNFRLGELWVQGTLGGTP